MSPSEILEIAKNLGMRITRAPVGSEMFECWADRVLQAWAYLSEGAVSAYHAAYDEADRYAI